MLLVRRKADADAQSTFARIAVPQAGAEPEPLVQQRAVGRDVAVPLAALAAEPAWQGVR